MLRFKYSDIIFYIHNLGKFDIVFIIKALLEYNKWIDRKVYKLEIIYRDNIILKLKIKKESNLVRILDSYYILINNLKNLYIKYEINIIKRDFSYKFANSNIFLI